MLGHCNRQLQPMIATAIRQICNADTGDQARERLGEVVERLQAPASKVARLLDEATEDLLAFYSFPREHWPKLRSTNPLERVNKEIGWRSDVVGIYPNDQALIRLAGMLLVEQNDCHEGKARPPTVVVLPAPQTRRCSINRFVNARRTSCSISVSIGEPGGRRGARSISKARCGKARSRLTRTA
jgi:transposase-like protein